MSFAVSARIVSRHDCYYSQGVRQSSSNDKLAKAGLESFVEFQPQSDYARNIFETGGTFPGAVSLAACADTLTRLRENLRPGELTHLHG